MLQHSRSRGVVARMSKEHAEGHPRVTPGAETTLEVLVCPHVVFSLGLAVPGHSCETNFLLQKPFYLLCSQPSLASGSQRQHPCRGHRPSDTVPADFGGQWTGRAGGGAGHTDPHRPSLPLGLCTPPVPSALAKCAPHGHDSAPSRWCHHAPYTQGCPTPGPATQTAGTAALALAEGSGSSQRGACGARRSEITAEVKETGARDGEAVRDHQKSLIRHTALFPWPRGVGDHSAHPISSQPFHMVVGLRSIPWLTPHPSSVLAP